MHYGKTFGAGLAAVIMSVLNLLTLPVLLICFGRQSVQVRVVTLCAYSVVLYLILCATLAVGIPAYADARLFRDTLKAMVTALIVLCVGLESMRFAHVRLFFSANSETGHRDSTA